MDEWVNDGARELPAGGEWRVVWRKAGDPGPSVTSRYTVVRTVSGRYRVAASTLYSHGTWSRVEEGVGTVELYRTRREAGTWARRMAELEAANRTAVAWDGRVPV